MYNVIKKAFLLTCIMLICGLSIAQEVTRRDSFLLRFKVLGDEIGTLKALDLTSEIQTANQQSNSLLSLEDIALDIPHLQIDFRLTEPKSKMFYALDFSLINGQGKEIFFDHTLSDEKIDTVSTAQNRFIWKDLLETTLDYDQAYYLKIKYNFFSPELNCNTPPILFKKKRPYVIAGAIGLGLIAAGELILKPRYQTTQRDYNQSWADAENRDDFYTRDQQTQFNRERDLYQAVNYGGIGILATEFVLVSYKFFNHKKLKNQYKTYCPQ